MPIDINELKGIYVEENKGTINQTINLPNQPFSLPLNIPSPKGFIGREVELLALRQAKTGGKTSFVLHGIGGVGKTDLALKFIDGIKADYSAHIRVDMFGLSDKPTTANDAKLEVIRMFKPDVPANLDDKNISNLYISLLNQHKTILFFDNAKDHDQVIPLWRDVPALVVITSRTNLRVADCFPFSVEQLSFGDARNLLYSVADEARFDGQADALAYLAGYLPMALLPLGGMLAEYITLEATDLVAKYADRKEERLQLADPNRENLSVKASFDLSYERLSEELQLCWRKLAVFPADFDLEAMQAVWQIQDGKKNRDELVNKHLLEFNPKTKRHHLHDLTRDYTNELISEDELFETQSRFSYYFGTFLSPRAEVTLENLNAIEIELINILNGFYWARNVFEFSQVQGLIHQSEMFAALCIIYAGSVGNTLKLKISTENYIALMEVGYSATKLFNRSDIPPTVYLGNLGLVYRDLKEYDKSIEYINKSLLIAKENQDKRTEAINLLGLGNTYLAMKIFDKAKKYLEEALNVSEEIGHSSLISKCKATLSSLGIYSGNYIEAIKTITDILEKDDLEIDTRASLLLNLGLCYFHNGDKDKGWELAKESMKLFKLIGKSEEEIIALIIPFDEK